MEAFGIYSLRATAVLILFWSIYRLFLQKETFYRFNRFFLLAGLLTALILPLIIIRYTVEVNTLSMIPIQIITAGEYAIPAAGTIESGSPFIKYFNLFLPAIYLTILCLIIIFRLVGLSRLFRTIHRNNKKRYTSYNLIESSEFEGAFSFFRFVFIPKNLNEQEKQIILKHEEAHIMQKHWIDLLLINIASLIWWFNPAIRLYEKAIRNNHEYLADQEVLTSYEQTDYQQTLINQWFKTSIFPMAHSFSYSNRLKRINMMKKTISNPLKKFSVLLALPGICLFLWSFSEPEYIVKNKNYSSEKDISMHNGEFEVSIKNGILSVNGMKEPPLTVLNGKVSDKNLHEFDTENFQSMTALTADDATEKYGPNGQNGAIEITTNNVKIENYTIIGEQTEIQEDTTRNGTHIKEQLTETDFWDSNPDILVIIDGEKKKDGLNTLKPEEIESISVLKKTSATEIYGEEGKNGVILITTKKKSSNHTRITLENTNDPLNDSRKILYAENKGLNISKLNSSNTPLYLVDGKKTDSIQQIDPHEIASISVLKDKSATEIYGEDGKNGIVLITTKKGRAIALKESGYEIQGSVTDETGIPIKNASIKVAEEETYTDKNGAFTTRIVSGDWLTVTADSYEKQTIRTEEDEKRTFFNITLKKEK